MADTAGKPQTPLLEWIAAGIGLLLLLALFAIIGREALFEGSKAPPAIEVSTGGITRTATGYLVAFEAINRANGTAASLQVEGTLRQGDTTIETSSTTLDYVPGHGSTRGGLYFTRDPRAHVLELRPLGFQQP
ncbi:hypothetical protein [Sphingomonas sp. M1-B02]|uniref:hypothetical protein n=1 Tax=Sphingomonas sp. M1-B02 TaxID=3114300 RepID=UPI00223FADDC|nr:hypothetical protein [Sphingomonas sp. S6-11]UZK66383.1 hypothetical protein OKW87_00645 [Sphingomonas sp. S6-11]